MHSQQHLKTFFIQHVSTGDHNAQLMYYKEVPQHFVKRSYYSVPQSPEITRNRMKDKTDNEKCSHLSFWWRSLDKTHRNGTSQGEGKEGRPGHQPRSQVAEGENELGVCHICAAFSDTSVHVTDLSGKETSCHVTCGMKVKAERDGSSPYAATLAAQDVAPRCKELGIAAPPTSNSGPQEETGPRPLDQGPSQPSQLSEPLPARE